MADETGNEPLANGEDTAPAVGLISQYVKDLSFENPNEDQIQPFLFAEAPRLVFPFARRVLADSVRDGGFPPLLLEPIDFGALYMQQALANAEGQGAAPAAEGNA